MKDRNNPASFMPDRIGEFYQIDKKSAGDIKGTESDYVQSKIEASVFDIVRELRVKIITYAASAILLEIFHKWS